MKSISIWLALLADNAIGCAVHSESAVQAHFGCVEGNLPPDDEERDARRVGGGRGTF